MIQSTNSTAIPSTADKRSAVEDKRQLLARMLRERASQTTRTCPVSAGQRALWFLHQGDPSSPAYNIAAAGRVRCAVDADVLKHAYQSLVDRHACLRTTFNFQDGEPVQSIHGSREVLFEQVHVDDLSWEQLQAKVTNEYQKPFDLENGPLLRVKLFTRSEEDHVLLMTAHHIVSDGWSTWLFVDEMTTLYQAELEGRKAMLPPLRASYEDFVSAENEKLASSSGQQLRDYWQHQLDGDLPILNLPTDRPRPSVQTSNGASFSLQLDKQIARQLRELARSEGATLYMTLLAAFQTLLHRQSGQSDLLVGSPTAGRNRTEFDGIVGYFVNPVVIRSNTSGEPSFRGFLQQTRQTVLDAMAHQEYPFPLLVDQLQPNRDPSHSPIFQASFVLQKPQRLAAAVDMLSTESDSNKQVAIKGLNFEPYPVAQQEGQFDLELEVVDSGEGLQAIFKYNADLFVEGTVARMAEQYQMLLEGAVAAPDEQISRLPLLSEAARDQLVIDWNQTDRNYPIDTCFAEQFERQVEASPNAVAAMCDTESVTYQQLNDRANRWARVLVEEGVGPDVFVSILAERGIDLLTIMLATFKAGGAYIPLDPRHPSSRLTQVFDESDCPLVVAQSQFVDVLSEAVSQTKNGDRPKVLTTEHLNELQPHESKNLKSRSTPGDLAYAIYTSGSTGIPKGAMVEQRGMVNHLYAKIEDLSITQSDRLAQNASQCFDISVWQYLSTLLVGGSVQIYTDEVAHDPHALLQRVADDEVTILEVVPSLLQQMLDIADQLETQTALPHLRFMMSTGEALPPELCRRWLQSFPNAAAVNAWGPTECSDDVTHCIIREPLADDVVNVPIGKPVGNMQTYILDANRNPVPIGVAGEIFVGGVGVGRGYLNRPEWTEKVFTSDPFRPAEGARFYRTGDLGRYLPDGNIEFLGRIDRQVKIRGFRIELGEIESALSQHDAIKQAAVVPLPSQSGKQLVAYVVPEGEDAPPISELRQFLKASLPEYMVPAVFVTIETMPLTTNGKVDVKALPAPDPAVQQPEREYVAPRNETEQLLVDLWSQVLGIEQVGIHDNFFELGGDSILSIQIIMRANQTGLNLTGPQVFQHQTVAELALVAESTEPAKVEQGSVTGTAPLTAAQKAFLDREFEAPQNSNRAYLFRANQRLAPEHLNTVVDALLSHHDALRLRFVKSDQAWTQRHAAPEDLSPFIVDQIEISGLSGVQQKKIIESTSQRVSSELNLSESLLRIVLFDLGDERPSRILIVAHRLIADDLSFRTIVQDLSVAYEQVKQGQPIELPEKTTPFKEWTTRLHELAESPELQQELDHWIMAPPKSGAGISKRDSLAAEVVRDSANQFVIRLDVDQTKSILNDVNKAYNTEVCDLLLTSLVQSVGRWNNQDSLLVSVTEDGRAATTDATDLSRSVGSFTTEHPVMLELANTSLGEDLKQIKEQSRRAPNRGIGHGLLRHITSDRSVRTKLAEQPQPEVGFSYSGHISKHADPSILRFVADLSRSGLKPYGKRPFSIEVESCIVRGRLNVRWTYNEDLFQRSTIEHLAHRFKEALEALIAHCLSTDTGGFTPSDFPTARLGQKQLDKVVAKLKKRKK